MKDLNREAMIELRRVVEAAPPELFHMRAWKEKAGCGTAYCAAGWAAIDPWFTERGLTHEAMQAASMDFRDSTFDAVRRFFGLTEAEGERLFGTSGTDYYDPHAITREMVIENIDRMLAGKRPRFYRGRWP